MLSDAFPPRKRGRAFGIFSMAVYAGGGIALVLGGGLLLLARRLVETMSAFSGMDPWHLVFLMVGAIGVPMAVLMAATPEPVRRRPTTATIRGTSLLRYIWRERRAFGWVDRKSTRLNSSH